MAVCEASQVKMKIQTDSTSELCYHPLVQAKAATQERQPGDNTRLNSRLRGDERKAVT
jgi:hypothetical protein